jgi:hypothetical protein
MERSLGHPCFTISGQLLVETNASLAIQKLVEISHLRSRTKSTQTGYEIVLPDRCSFVVGFQFPATTVGQCGSTGSALQRFREFGAPKY